MILRPGTRFGSFTLGKLLGSGRVADVFEVISSKGERFALKVLREALPLDAKPQARLGQEAEILATLDDLNVVRYFDSGVDLGRVWILVELVEGADLRQLVNAAGGALPVEQAVRIVRQVCEGVAAAHALGVLHRDLAPENILVGVHDFTKVADFGSAKPAKYGVKTTTEQDLASFFYIAPEYLKSHIAWPAGDVYSVGVLLYEILAGGNPIALPDLSMIDICRRHLSFVPPPLDTLERDIPGDLSALVQRAMAKDPASRPTMREMADRLAVILDRLTVQRRAGARSLPLPNREPGLAMTELDMPAFHLGATMPLAGVMDRPPSPSYGGQAPPGAAAPDPDAGRTALPPPAPSGSVSTSSPSGSVSTTSSPSGSAATSSPSGVVPTWSPPSPSGVVPTWSPPSPSGVVPTWSPPSGAVPTSSPPAPSGLGTTLRSPAYPPSLRAPDGAAPFTVPAPSLARNDTAPLTTSGPSLATDAAVPPTERGSTTAPVERPLPPLPLPPPPPPPRASRALPRAAGASIAVLALLGAGWMLLERRGVAPASPPPPPLPSASTSAPPPAASAVPAPTTPPTAASSASRPKAPAASSRTPPPRSKRPGSP
jgi:serine/threonine-protein kinase